MFGLSIWWRLFIFAIAMALGFWALIKPLQVGNLVGRIDMIEQKFGPGRTYTFVQLFAIFMIIMGFAILFRG